MQGRGRVVPIRRRQRRKGRRHGGDRGRGTGRRHPLIPIADVTGKKETQGPADERVLRGSERKEEEGLRLAGLRQLGRLVGCTDGLRDLLRGRRPAAARWAYTSKGGLSRLSELDRI
jgi:hypothetical protein